MYDPDREFNKQRDVKEGKAIEIPCKLCGEISIFDKDDEPKETCDTCKRELLNIRRNQSTHMFNMVVDQLCKQGQGMFLLGWLQEVIRQEVSTDALDELTKHLDAYLIK